MGDKESVGRPGSCPTLGGSGEPPRTGLPTVSAVSVGAGSSRPGDRGPLPRPLAACAEAPAQGTVFWMRSRPNPRVRPGGGDGVTSGVGSVEGQVRCGGRLERSAQGRTRHDSQAASLADCTRDAPASIKRLTSADVGGGGGRPARRSVSPVKTQAAVRETRPPGPGTHVQSASHRHRPLRTRRRELPSGKLFHTTVCVAEDAVAHERLRTV